MLAHISIYGEDIPIYGYLWIRQYGSVLYIWAGMKFLPIKWNFIFITPQLNGGQCGNHVIIIIHKKILFYLCIVNFPWQLQFVL